MVDRDLEHLRLLAIFHYILGGLLTLCGFFSFIHLGLGIAMVAGALDGGRNPPPPEFGWLFIIAAGFAIVAAWTLAVCMVLVGLKLVKQKNYWFCFVVAIIECLFQPLGTVLGIFTIIVLQRASVKDSSSVSWQIRGMTGVVEETRIDIEGRSEGGNKHHSSSTD